MEIKHIAYLKMLLLHVFFGVLIFYIPVFSKIISILLFFVFSFIIIRNKNKNNEALLFSAYIVASEVFFRMTDGTPNNEFGKYSVIIFLFIGTIYSGFSDKSIIYWIFLLLLIPGVLLGIYSLSPEMNIRKAIAFNISGPVCLAISAIYCYKRRINFGFLEKLITIMIYPIVSTLVFMFLFTPTDVNVFTGTESNFMTSGGFGPNQVSTMLGLGMFVVFIRLIFFSKEFVVIAINLFLLSFITYRGLLTFSRGGVYTGIIMIVLCLISTFFILNNKGKFKINLIIIITMFFGFLIFAYSSFQTDGLLDKRYAGEDALGREKVSKFSGREALVEGELQMFFDNPITGIGVGVNKQAREESSGVESASHNEVSRMLAEHGLIGIIDLLILLITPFYVYFNNKKNIFLLSFYIFWLLTINHAAMRLAAPAFIYALSLLDISMINQNAIKTTINLKNKLNYD